MGMFWLVSLVAAEDGDPRTPVKPQPFTGVAHEPQWED